MSNLSPGLVALMLAVGITYSGCSAVTDFDGIGNQAQPNTNTDGQVLPDANRVDARPPTNFDGAADAYVPPVDAAPDGNNNVCPGGCDDKIECTVDICQPNGKCAHRPDDTRCEGLPNICLTGRCMPKLSLPGTSGCFTVPKCTRPTDRCDPQSGSCVECVTSFDCQAVDCCTPGECMPNGTCRKESRCGDGDKERHCCGSLLGCRCAKEC